ncbi:MAG: rhamnulokinase [Ruminococcaceae bacterium]|nr:rhamnulokinase [Oscillospiraceae bacterium]
MMTYLLAIDLGASSGRHILGYIENGRIRLEEVHRFDDYLREENGSFIWDIEKMVSEVKAGIAKCERLGKIPATIAIDTWGVDYVLLDENKQELLPAYSYRDNRNNLIQDEVAAIISQEELYAKTGIQKANYNTIYQLYCDKKSGKLDKAKYFMNMPDYLAFKLTGVIKNEYTEASTTNLINAQTKSWDEEILDTLGIRKDIFSEVSLPCTEVGKLQGFDFESTVILAPSHDTASAVAACPTDENGVYISSGTWSLIGTENLSPVLSEAALKANFTNEGGINHRFRFLKNYMGMWLFQNIRKEINSGAEGFSEKISYDDMMNLAKNSGAYEYIDTNDISFLAPSSMINAIRAYLKNDSMPIDAVINSVYHSLAKAYANVVSEIESVCKKTVDTINIVGGGCKDKYLNQLTAEYTGKRVLAGPVEATATGNIISQMMFTDKDLTLEKARELVKISFDIEEIK